MKKPKWRRMREAGAAASSAALLRPGASGDGDQDDQPCPECNGTGVDDGEICATCNGTGSVMRESDTLVCSACGMADCEVPGVERIREALSTKQRQGLDKGQFAIPEKAPGPGSYPIPDKDHIGPALSLAKQHDPGDLPRIRAFIKRKFPGTDVGDGGKTKESMSLMERLEALEQETSVVRSLREAQPMSMAPTFSQPTRVKTSGGREGYRVTLIREGKGNHEDDQWYGADAIQEMCESGVCEGMQAFGDHPDLEEEEKRPERSVKDLVGTYHDVHFVAESGGPARAEAVFVPLSTDENNPRYGWVITLAEAAVRSTAAQPICGISLYGLSAGDDMQRPDGSYGRMVSMVRPSSGDIVTNAGAGGGFIRQLMESARALRNRSQKELTPMKALAYQTAVREATKRVREADSDETREVALKDLDKITSEAVEEAPTTVEALSEAAPALVASIREAATVKAGETVEELQGQLASTQDKLREAEGALTRIADVGSIARAVREALGEDADRLAIQRWIDQAEMRGLKEADVKRMIETEKEYEEQQGKRRMEQLRESLGLDEESSMVEGIFFRAPTQTNSDGGVSTLRESGVPLKEAS